MSRWNELWTDQPLFQLPGSTRPAYTATSAEAYFENWYGNRADLGNVEPGDGYRYRGRGPIQLTGRSNYAAAGRALGLDLINNPDLVADRFGTPSVCVRVAGWFWSSRAADLNALADRRDFEAITGAINGGTNGTEDRLTYYNRALTVLGA